MREVIVHLVVLSLLLFLLFSEIWDEWRHGTPAPTRKLIRALLFGGSSDDSKVPREKLEATWDELVDVKFKLRKKERECAALKTQLKPPKEVPTETIAAYVLTLTEVQALEVLSTARRCGGIVQVGVFIHGAQVRLAPDVVAKWEKW